MTINLTVRPAITAVASTLNVKNTIRNRRAAREAIAQDNILVQAHLATSHAASRVSEQGLFEGKTEEQIMAWYEAEYAAQVILASQK